MRALLLAPVVLAATVAAAPPAAATTARTAEQLNALASLRYQAAQTQVVSAQQSDAKLIAMRGRVAQSESALAAARAQLAAARQSARTASANASQLAARVDALLGELAAAKDDFTQELARRDAAYAADLALLQLAGEQLLATPEGLRALELYNAGGPGAFAAADAVLGEIEAARAKARAAAAEAQLAEDRRVRARFASDANRRGLAPLSAAIERWQAVVALGRPVTRDWLTLTDLFSEAGQILAAQGAADQAIAVAANDFDRMLGLGRKGDALQLAGSSSAARDAFRAAMVIARARLAKAPDDPDAMWSVTALLRKQGSVALDFGEIAAARADFAEALRLDTRRQALTPKLEIQRDIAVNLELLGDVEAAEGKSAAALAAVRDGVDRARAILAADPALTLSKTNLGGRLSELANYPMDEGRYADAIALLREAAALVTPLVAADPQNFDLADHLTRHLSGLIYALDSVEATDAAAAARAERAALRRRMIDTAPGSIVAKTLEAEMLVDDAGQAMARRDYAAAETAWQAEAAIAAELLAGNPTPANRLGYAESLQSLAITLEMQEKFAEAETQYRAALAQIPPLTAVGGLVSVREMRANVAGNYADLLGKMKRPADGVPLAREAVDIWRSLAAQSGSRRTTLRLLDFVGNLATLSQQSGKAAEALALRREALATRRALLANSETPQFDRERLAQALLTGARTATLAKDSETAQAWYREGTDVLRAMGPERSLGDLDQFIFSLRNFAAAPGMPEPLRAALLAEAAEAEAKREDVWRKTKDTP